MPCGLATGLDIGLSNSSLKVISLSFYTMVKSAAPVFVVLFAFLFGLEKPTCMMLSTISVICLGVFLMVASETREIHFDLTGYLQVQSATILSGLRWTLTQILLDRESIGLNNPLATTLFLSPLVAFSLLPAFLISEGWMSLGNSRFFDSFSSTLHILGIIGFGGSLSFLMSLAEFKLIASTSIITFTIAGIVKEILTIATASVVFGDKISGNKAFGLIISILGIAMYNYIRIWKNDSRRS
jgi:solute carrier family 35 protein C2